MTTAVAAGIYLGAVVLVLWAGSRRIGSRSAYVIASAVLLTAGALAIILSPASAQTGLEPARPWFSGLKVSGSWVGGGLLVLGLAALAASLVYPKPADAAEELDG